MHTLIVYGPLTENEVADLKRVIHDLQGRHAPGEVMLVEIEGLAVKDVAEVVREMSAGQEPGKAGVESEDGTAT